MVTISRAEYASESGRDELNQKLDWLLEQVRLNRKKLYGVSSERAGRRTDRPQLSLMFDETEAWLSRRRAKETEVAAHTRRSSRPEEVLPDNVPVEVVEHRIPEKEPDCPVCGTAKMEIGRDVRRIGDDPGPGDDPGKTFISPMPAPNARRKGQRRRSARRKGSLP